MQQATAELHSPSSEPAVSDAARDQKANDLVNRYTAWTAAAGIIPIPIVDMLAVGGLQFQMMRQLAAIYDVEFSENLGKSSIAAVVGALIPAGAAPVAAMGVASALKFIPIVGTTIASVTMPALSAGATYAIGRVFILHFASGGTLLDFNPREYREFIREQADKAKTSKDGTTAASPAAASGHTASSHS
jgi:uncharacterized protein (DUF697 family)